MKNIPSSNIDTPLHMIKGFGGKRQPQYPGDRDNFIPEKGTSFLYTQEYRDFITQVSSRYPAGTKVMITGQIWYWDDQVLRDISITGIMGEIFQKFDGSPLNIGFDGSGYDYIPPDLYLTGFSITKIN